MDALTQSQAIFLQKLVAAYEREQQTDHPAYQQALHDLAQLQYTTVYSDQYPASTTEGRFDSSKEQ